MNAVIMLFLHLYVMTDEKRFQLDFLNEMLWTIIWGLGRVHSLAVQQIWTWPAL